MGQFNLGTNTSVPLSAIETAADGSVVTNPAVFSVDDATVMSLVDNGDGTAVATRTSVAAGKATVTVVVTNPDGSTVTDSLEIDFDAQGGKPGTNATSVVIVPGVAS